MPSVPETRYVKTSDGQIAYQVLGNGPPDIVYVSTWFSHVDGRWEEPSQARWLHRIAGFGRLILFDRRGTGASDPLRLERGLTWEEWVDDIAAVMDAVGSERASIIAGGDGGAMGMLFAASHPARVRSLVVVNSSARPLEDEGYRGLSEAQVEALIGAMQATWGRGAFESWVPSRTGDENFRRWWARYQRMASSPGVAAAVGRLIFTTDIRHVLPTISVPTLIVHRRDCFVPVEQGRFLGEHIRGAQYLEFEGADTFSFTGDNADEVQDAIERFVTGTAPQTSHDRVLATVVFTDIVGSTEHATRLGDARWRELLDEHDGVLRDVLHDHRGHVMQTTGDGVLAIFDGPARAIRFGLAVRDAIKRLGIEIRVGMHTGEIERRGSEVSGVAVHIAARVSSIAQANEVLVSRTVRDLVTGSGIDFSHGGTHRLRGVPDEWQLYRVTNAERATASTSR